MKSIEGCQRNVYRYWRRIMGEDYGWVQVISQDGAESSLSLS